MKYRRAGLNALFRAATATLKEIWGEKRAGIPGIISVVHTFGGDLKWNPHVHTIVTCGGLRKEEDGSWRWVGVDSVHFAFLRRCWRYHVIDELRLWGRRVLSKEDYDVCNRDLNAWYVLDGKKEWYVNWGKKLTSLEHTVKYVGRYTKKPVIAETRLKSFDGECVEFSHKDKVRKEEVTIRMEVREFIGKLVRHIPEKHQRNDGIGLRGGGGEGRRGDDDTKSAGKACCNIQDTTAPPPSTHGKCGVNAPVPYRDFQLIRRAFASSCNVAWWQEE